MICVSLMQVVKDPSLKSNLRIRKQATASTFAVNTWNPKISQALLTARGMLLGDTTLTFQYYESLTESQVRRNGLKASHEKSRLPDS